MKTKFSYIASSLLSLLLCAVMLCGAILPASADGTELPSLDYSNPNMGEKETLSAQDLYTILLNRTPTEGETMYWKAQELSLSYTDFIPKSCIDTYYDKEVGRLTVTVSPYSYTAANGALVTWIPESFDLEGKQYALQEQNGVYVAQVDNCFYSGNFDMQVEYGCEIEVPQSVIQALMSEAYEMGTSAIAEMNEYNKKLEEYKELVEEHEAYNAYVEWEERYQNYLAEKAVYEKLVAAYEAYQAELIVYQTTLDAYNQWQNYFDQQKAYNNYLTDKANYEKFKVVYDAAVNKLAMFEGVFKRDSNGWCMYSDIMGKSVTQVLSMQETLIGKSGEEEGVNSAGDATENLRVLLKGYNDLRTKKWPSDYAKYQALYQYYTDNYDALKKNFCDLYYHLYDMYMNSAGDVVYLAVGTLGKTAHYQQLVGHLYVISTSFDQNTHRNESTWIIGKNKNKKTLRQVVEDVHYFPDGDWDPRNTAYPAVEVPPVKPVEPPVRPTVPQQTAKPKLPAEVKHPGNAPAVVENPANTPRPPKPEKEVGEVPARPEFEEIEGVLYQEVLDGKLKAPTQDASAKKIPLTSVLEHTASIENLKTITFYDVDGKPIEEYPVHYGTEVNVDEVKAPRESTPEYTYEFLGWSYADGSPVTTTFVSVTENTSLYPRYLATKRMYTVTWILDGTSYSQTLYYGVTPSPELIVDTSSRETPYYIYQFSGWDPVVTPVTGDVTYEGKMERIPKKFNVTWVIKNGTESITQEWEYNQKPVFEGELSFYSPTHIYEFLTWDKTVSPVSRDVTYTAIYRATPLATGGLNTTMDIVHSDTEITVLATKSSISARQAALLAAAEGKTLTILWEGALSVSLSGDELQTYIDCGTPKIILQQTEVGSAMNYEFKYSGASANASALPSATVVFDYSNADGRETVFDLQTAEGWKRIDAAVDGVQITAVGDFTARRLYSYSIIPEANEYCNVTQIITQATEGEWVTIALDCENGYKVTGATLVTTEGETITVSGESFQMPAASFTISLKVEKIVYTVIFMVDGEIWNTANYYTGDKIVLPENPTKAEENGYAYTFIGWGEVPAIAMGEDEELVFEASFHKSEIVINDNTNDGNGLIVIIVVCVAVVVLLVVFLIARRIIRRRGGWRVVSTKIGAACKRFFSKLKKSIQALFKRPSSKNKK